MTFPVENEKQAGELRNENAEGERGKTTFQCKRMCGGHSLSMRSSPSMSLSHSAPHPHGQFLSCQMQRAQWCRPAWRVQNNIIRSHFINEINMLSFSCYANYSKFIYGFTIIHLFKMAEFAAFFRIRFSRNIIVKPADVYSWDSMKFCTYVLVAGQQ